MRNRVGLISVYSPFFDQQMPSGFRQTQANFARQMEATLRAGGLEVIFPGLIESDATGQAAGRKFSDSGIEGLVVAPTMAAPPSYAVAAIEECPRPVLIWNCERSHSLSPALTEAEATGLSGLVGCIMVSNTLMRRKHPFAAVSCSMDNPDEMRRITRLAKVICFAHRFRRMKLVRVGNPIPGYLDVELDTVKLEQDLGPKVIDVHVDQLERVYQEKSEADVNRFLAELPQRGWHVLEDWEELRSSARIALALEELCRVHCVDAGAVNCHGPLFRENPTTGIVACLGVSWLSAQGQPLACTGDLLTAIALKIGKELTGSALYCEYYARESNSGLMLIAAGGEGDPTIAGSDATIEVYANRHYPGVKGCGACVRFKLRPGPATVLSFTPSAAGWTLIWATGEVLTSHFPGMAGPNALFRYSRGNSAALVERLCELGPPHHNALVPEHIGEELSIFAKLVGIEGVSIVP